MQNFLINFLENKSLATRSLRRVNYFIFFLILFCRSNNNLNKGLDSILLNKISKIKLLILKITQGKFLSD